MKREKYISPSLMCCDFFNLEKYISTFEKEKIEYLHIDIMDGTFVPNYTLGTDFVKQLKRRTNIPLDIHLMVEKPELKLEYFEFGENDIVSVHAETTKHLQRVLQKIKDRGAKAYVAINPATPISYVEEVLEDIDGVLVMTVNPGLAGQKLVPSSIKKIARVRKLLDENGREDALIEVDGNVSFINTELMNNAGADVFVAGSSSVFGIELSQGIKKMREILAK